MESLWGSDRASYAASYTQCLAKTKKKNSKEWNAMHSEFQLFFLTKFLIFSVQSLSHRTMTPSTVRWWPSVAKFCIPIQCGKLFLPLEVFLLNPRTEKSCGCLYSREIGLGNKTTITSVPYRLWEIWFLSLHHLSREFSSFFPVRLENFSRLGSLQLSPSS